MKGKSSSRSKQGGQQPRRQVKKAKQPAAFGEMGGHTNLTAAAFVVRPAETKYGLRSDHWGKVEYAQFAIGALYAGGLPPPHVSHSQLTREVNAWLAKNPHWKASRYQTVSRMTTMRALETYRAVNR